MRRELASDVTRTVLQILSIVAMIAASLWILLPFLLAGTWGTIIAVATWPVMLRAEEAFDGRRAPAVAVMTVALLVVLMLPLSLATAEIVENADRIGAWLGSMTTIAIPPPPPWLETLPFVGTRAVSRWQQLAAAKPEEIAARLAPYTRSVLEWFISQVGGFGMLILTVIVAAIIYANGEAAARGVTRFAGRLAGGRGEEAVTLAGQAVRAVALGVVMTALIQSALGGIGLVAAGIPVASVLTGIMFILGVCQIGPMPVLLPAVGWLYWRGDAFWGTALLIWAIPVGLLDNFLRPVLIRRGANLSMLLILPGVIGGLLAFGIIGLFVGPVVLAVAYTLLAAWVNDDTASVAPDEPADLV